MRITWLVIGSATVLLIPRWVIRPTDAPGVRFAKAYFKSEAPLFAYRCKTLDSVLHSIDLSDGPSTATATIDEAKRRLIECRLQYKKIESFLEYFFRNSAHVYNGPPKYEAEEPFMEYQEPAGLQVIESLLFDKNVAAHREELLQQSELLTSSATDLPSLLYNLDADDPHLLESLRLELIRIMTLGITGYDAPLLKSGITESSVALCSIRATLLSYLTHGQGRSDSLLFRLDKAIEYLERPSSFDDFDRMTFLVAYAMPLQYQLGALIREKGLECNTTGALNYNADNLFSRDMLDPYHFPGAQKDADRLLGAGRQLFLDSILSGNGQKSCASCHSPEKMFTDGLPQSLALDGLTRLPRNAPSLLYAGFQYSQFWDGRARTLEDQISQVLHDPMEMRASDTSIVRDINERPFYDSFLKRANPDRTGRQWDMDLIVRALGAYVRSLHPQNAAFDRFMAGNRAALSPDQIKGANLFMGKAQCATCHFMPLFNGLMPPEYQFTEFEVLGTTATDDFIHPVTDTDLGKYAVYPLPFNKRSFKTPTVRNTASTYPYMHNGALADMEKVMEFYNKGGGAGLGLDIPEQTLPGKPLLLTKREMKEIILFLQALTDTLPSSSKELTIR